MNVLATLSQGLSRTGIQSPRLSNEKILLHVFEMTRKSGVPKKVNERLNNRSRLEKAKIRSIDEDVMKAVGGGSNFQKKAVKEYLSPLQLHDLSRHHIRNDFDNKKASLMHRHSKLVEKSKNSQEILFRDSRQFVGDLLGSLVACNTKHEQPSTEKVIRRFPKWTMQEVPRIPNFTANPDLFEDYIGLLTHTKFLYKNSSSTSGIVPMILRNLMHPANIKTLYLRTTRTYNDLIYYFCEKFDFASCREIFAQMKIEGVPRNTMTYNLMLRSVLKNSHIRKTKSIYPEVLYYFRSMAKNSIEADSVTWTTCYNFLKEDISRSIYVEKMLERNVPVTDAFIYTVLRNSSYSSKECLQFLASNRIPLSSKLFNLCIDRLLQEDRSNVAWLFLEHTVLKKDKGFVIGTSTLNAFMRHFASRGRLDMAIATFNTCSQDYHMKPDSHTFEMLFKALTSNGYTKHFSLILEYLKGLRKNHNLGARTNYWLTRANAIAIFNVRQSDALPKEKLNKSKELLNGFKWSSTSSGFTLKLWKENGPSIKKICRLLGCIPTPLRLSRGERKITPVMAARLKAKKKRYLRRIRCIAIQGAMRKRVPFAHNWYGSLRRELEQRDIIDNSVNTVGSINKQTM